MWLYDGRELKDEDIPEKAIGFLYIITQLSTGKKYIGRKMLTMSAGKKKVGNRTRKVRKESDWRDYWSSSPQIKEWIEENGTADFTKEILFFCFSKGALAYAEENLLHYVGAIESDNWLNLNIRSKLYNSWIQGKPEVEFLKETKKKLNLL